MDCHSISVSSTVPLLAFHAQIARSTVGSLLGSPARNVTLEQATPVIPRLPRRSTLIGTRRVLHPLQEP